MIDKSKLEKIKQNFNTSMKCSVYLYNLKHGDDNISMFQDSFDESLHKLRTRSRTRFYPNKRVGFFPVAGDPIHWAHLLTAFKILADHDLDQIVIISGGYDPSKPKLVHPDIRFPMIKEALKIFEELIVLSDITLEKEYALQKGENNLFNLLHKAQETYDAYYIVGSDHYNWSATGKDGVTRDDTLKILSDNIEKNKFKRKHSISAIFILRGGESAEELNAIKPPNFKVLFNEPHFAYSSTQIRNEFKNTTNDGSITYIPSNIYNMIVEKNLYVS